jgi:hypothetical protein
MRDPANQSRIAPRGTFMATVVQDDPIEMLYERGVTDGLPVVPPTRERVDRMLAGAPWRKPDELIGVLGPQLGKATVEKVAINAVMAGCKPALRYESVRAWAQYHPDVRCASGNYQRSRAR